MKWIVVFLNAVTGGVFFHLSDKENELDAVEEAGTKMPKSSWIWGIIKDPTPMERKKAKEKMTLLRKTKEFKLKENPDGTVYREEE